MSTVSGRKGHRIRTSGARDEAHDAYYDSYEYDDRNRQKYTNEDDSIERGGRRVRSSHVSRTSEEWDEANEAFEGSERNNNSLRKKQNSLRSSSPHKRSLRTAVQDFEDEEESDELDKRAEFLVRCPIIMTSSEENNFPESSKPMCTIRLTGSRYQKDIELNLDKEVDDVIYRILKSMDEECVDLSSLRLSGKKRPFGFLQHCLAPLASCFSVKPPVRKSRGKHKSPCPCHSARQSRPRRSSCSPEKNWRESIDESDESCEEEKPRRSTHHRKKRKRKKSCCQKLLKGCRKTLPFSRSCCLKDDVVLIEIVPSRATDTDVKYKKHKERGVGTDTSPELEILLNGDERCVAKKTGKKCACRVCCPKSKKKCKPKKTQPEPIKEESEEETPIEKKKSNESRKSGESRRSRESVRRRGSTTSNDPRKLSFERTYSLLVNSNYDPTWDSDYASTSASMITHMPLNCSMGRKKNPLLQHVSRSEPLNVYSALQQRFMDVVNVENLKRRRKMLTRRREFDKMYQPIVDKIKPVPYATTNRRRKMSSRLFFGRDYILELHETSESVEKTVKTQNTKQQTVRISDYLRLHKLFQRSRISMTSSATRAVTSIPSDNESEKHKKTMKFEIKKKGESSVIVLKNEYSSHHNIVGKIDSHTMTSNGLRNADSPPKGTLRLESSKLLFMKFPPAKKSTNLLAFLKNLHTNKNNSKAEETEIYNENAKLKKSFTRQCVKNFEKLKIYFGKTKKIKLKPFIPVTLDKKQGMLNLSSLSYECS